MASSVELEVASTDGSDDCSDDATLADDLSSSVDDNILPLVQTPVPWRGVLTLCLMFFCEALAITFFWPFVGLMVESFGYERESVGYGAGAVASTWAFAQFLSGMFWGRLSDRVGRRPIMMSSLAGNMVFTALFGFSTSLPMALAFRFASGSFSASIVTAKTYMREITDETNQARAFSMIGCVWSFGLIIGPVVGGYLSQPNVDGGLFATYPFLPPCLFVAFVNFLGLVFGFFFLKESLPAKKNHADSFLRLKVRSSVDGNGLESSAANVIAFKVPARGLLSRCCRSERQYQAVGEETPGEPPSMSAWQVLRQKTVAMTCSCYVLMAFMHTSMDEVFSLFAIQTVKSGGLGFDTSDIATAIIPGGAAMLVYQLFVFPRLDRAFGTLKIFKWASIPLPIAFFFIPFCAYIAAWEDAAARPLLWSAVISLCMLRFLVAATTFTCVMLLINNSAPPDHIGAVNGLSTSGAALVRCTAPVLSGSVLSWSLTSGLPFPFNASFLFTAMAVLAMLTTILSWQLPSDLARRYESTRAKQNAIAH